MFQKLLLASKTVQLGFGFLLLMVQPALAQQPDPAASKEAWVVSYALVILFVGLGLFVVSLPSRRQKKVRKK